MNRRRFLGSTALASIFGKPAADAAMAQAGMGSVGNAGLPLPMSSSGLTARDGATHIQYLRRRVASLRKLFGMMPEWKRRELVERAGERARRLDPDIASMRSISLAGKYQMQCRREYQYLVDVDGMWPERELSEMLWNQENGFE